MNQARTALVAVAALLLAGCAELDDPTARVRCDPRPGEVNHSLVLMAQSVPTAPALPCVRAAPADWTMSDFSARSGRSRFSLSYVLHGAEMERGVTVELTRRCNTGGAKEVTTEQPLMRRYDREVRGGSRYADERFLVTAGSCVRYRFDLRGTGAEQQATEIWSALGFVGRDVLRAQIREHSDGRLDLDPAPDADEER